MHASNNAPARAMARRNAKTAARFARSKVGVLVLAFLMVASVLPIVMLAKSSSGPTPPVDAFFSAGTPVDAGGDPTPIGDTCPSPGFSVASASGGGDQYPADFPATIGCIELLTPAGTVAIAPGASGSDSIHVAIKDGAATATGPSGTCLGTTQRSFGVPSGVGTETGAPNTWHCVEVTLPAGTLALDDTPDASFLLRITNGRLHADPVTLAVGGTCTGATTEFDVPSGPTNMPTPPTCIELTVDSNGASPGGVQTLAAGLPEGNLASLTLVVTNGATAAPGLGGTCQGSIINTIVVGGSGTVSQNPGPGAPPLACVEFTVKDPSGATVQSGALGSPVNPLVASGSAGLVIVQTGTNTRVAEGGATDSYTIHLASQPAGTVTVHIAADADLEVANIAGTGNVAPVYASSVDLVFPAAASSVDQTVNVRALDDAIDEVAPEIAHLTHTATGDAGYVALGSVDLPVSVSDNDVAKFSVNDVRHNEGNGGGTTAFDFSVQVTASDFTTQIDFATQAGTAGSPLDFASASGTLSFPPSSAAQIQTVSVNVVADALPEPDETFAVALTTPQGGALVADGSGLGTIVDDDTLTAFSVTLEQTAGSTQVSEDGATDSYTIQLNQQPTGDVTVTVHPCNDVTVSSLPAGGMAGDLDLSFTAQTYLVPQTIYVTANDDLVDEPNGEPCLITHAISGGGYSTATIPDVTAAVADNDAAAISITDVSMNEGNSGTTAFTFNVHADPSAFIITVDYQTLDGTATAPGDYASASSFVSIPASDSARDGTFTINVNGDTASEGTESFSVLLSNARGGDAHITDTSATAKILDDDVAIGLLLRQMSGGSEDGATTVTEGGSTDTVQISLKSRPSTPVAVTITADDDVFLAVANPNEGAVTNDKLTVVMVFTPVDFATPRTLVVSANDDNAIESNDADGLVTIATQSQDTNYNTLAATIPVNVVDNDNARWGFGSSAPKVSEGGVLSFTVKLANGQSLEDFGVSIHVASADGSGTVADSDYTPIADQLVSIGIGQTQQTVTVQTTLDAICEGDEGVRLTLNTPSARAVVATASQTGTILTDDLCLLIGKPLSGIAVTEGDANRVSFTVALASDPGSSAVAVTVDPDGDLAVTDDADNSIPNPNGDPTESNDNNVILLFDSDTWNVPQLVVVKAIDDGAIEFSPDAAALALTVADLDPTSDATYDGLAQSESVAVTDNDNARISVDKDVHNTEGLPLSFTIKFASGQSLEDDVPVGIHYATSDGTATLADSDYTSTSGDLVWAPSQGSKTVTVPTTGDSVIEPTEALTLTLSSPLARAVVGSKASGIGTIDTDDFNTISIDPTSLSIPEGGKKTFSIQLGLNPAAPVVIRCTPDGDITLGGSTAAPQPDGSVLLAFGPSPTAPAPASQGVEVTAGDNSEVDGAHGAVVSCSADSQDPAFSGYPMPDVTISIQDNDVPAVPGIYVVESAATTAVTEAGQTDSYTIALGSAPESPVTIRVRPDAQVKVSSDVPNLPDGSLLLQFTKAESHTVTVTAVDDNVDEADVHTGVITHSVQTQDAQYAAFTARSVSVSITDNDGPAAVVITPTGAGTEVTEGGGADTYAIHLSSKPTQPVTVTIRPDSQVEVSSDNGVSNPADGSLVLVFQNDNTYGQDQIVSVSAVDDADVEGTHTGVISHNVRSQDPVYNGFSVPNVLVTIHDNDALPSVIITESASTTVSENGATDTYDVKLSAPPAQPVLVTVTPNAQVTVEGTGPAANPQDHSIVLLFSRADWNMAHTVTVKAVDDDVVEGAHAGLITHAATSADDAYNGIPIANVVVAIADNDASTLTVADKSAPEGNSGSSNLGFKIDLSKASATLVTVNVQTLDVSAQGGSDYVAVASTPVVFSPGEKSKTFNVAINGDTAVETDETFKLQIASVEGDGVTVADGEGLGTIQNDDGLVLLSHTSLAATEGGDPVQYEVVLQQAPEAPVRVDITPDAQVAVGLGADPECANSKVGTVTLVFTPADFATPKTICVIAVDDDAAEGAHTGTISHAVSSVDTAYDGIAVPDVTVQITDNDGAGTLSASTDGPAVVIAEDPASPIGNVGTYTLSLSRAPTADVLVTITLDGPGVTLSGTGVTPVGSHWTLTFATGETSKEITVTAIDNHLVDGVRKLQIHHVAGSADAGINGAEADMDVIIVDAAPGPATVCDGLPLVSVCLVDDQQGAVGKKVNDNSPLGPLVPFGIRIRIVLPVGPPLQITL